MLIFIIMDHWNTEMYITNEKLIQFRLLGARFITKHWKTEVYFHGVLASKNFEEKKSIFKDIETFL